MTSSLEGVADLTAKLRALASPKEQAATLRAAVRTPMREVMRLAKVNIARVSPGQRPLHRTYKGRIVSAGFAARNVRMIVKMSKDKQKAQAILGVRAEAFYALQFLELGTAKIASRPWLQPAFSQSRDQVVRLVGETLKARIDRIAKSKHGGA